MGLNYAPTFGVKNGILLAAVLIKCCNCVDKSFIRKGSESWAVFCSDFMARGVGFEPTRPLPATDLAGLPPTRLGQPRNCALSHLLDYSMGGQSVDCGTWSIFVFVLCYVSNWMHRFKDALESSFTHPLPRLWLSE